MCRSFCMITNLKMHSPNFNFKHQTVISFIQEQFLTLMWFSSSFFGSACCSCELRFLLILSNSGILGLTLRSSRDGLRLPTLAVSGTRLISLRVSSDSEDSMLPSPLLLRMCSAKCFSSDDADVNRDLQSVQLKYAKGPTN
jgi:hypothetical protein